MINSMTAYARVECPCSTGSVVCEIRSVNSKNLDLSIRLPQGFSEKEEAVKKTVAAKVARGRIEIFLKIDGAGPTPPVSVLNPEAARSYYEALCQLQNQLGISGAIDLALIAAAPGVVQLSQPCIDVEENWPAMIQCVEAALDALCGMRAREGSFLRTDFEQRLELIEGFLKGIVQESDGLLAWYQQRLVDRIGALVGNQVAIDPARVAQEAAFLASKSDITEELTRLSTHITHFRSIMDAPEPSGRKLNFLIQEMHREINTIGSKTEKAGVAHRVVDIKAELEKLREQVQNVE
jgi:uncharacterized protein (TIGR00255 family)